jgi:hypothetical protein
MILKLFLFKISPFKKNFSLNRKGEITENTFFIKNKSLGLGLG